MIEFSLRSVKIDNHKFGRVKHLSFRELLTKADVGMGKALFGNSNRLSLNLKGYLDELNSKTPQTLDTNLQYLSGARKLRKSGCSFLVNTYPKEIMSPIVSEFNVAIEDESLSEASDKHLYNGKFLRWTIRDARKVIPSLEKLMTDELKGTLEQYYQGHFNVIRVVAYRNYHVPNKLAEEGIYSNLWHCDARRPSLIKLMLNVSDVGKNDGPLHVLSKEKTRRMMKLGFKNRRELGGAALEIEEAEGLVKLTGVSGTGLLCNLNACLHKAGVPETTRKRDLIQMLFAPSRKPLSSNWMTELDIDIR